MMDDDYAPIPECKDNPNKHPLLCLTCEKYNACFHIVPCHWKCPLCGRRCGGIEGHRGGHQCSVHSSVPASTLVEEVKK